METAPDTLRVIRLCVVVLAIVASCAARRAHAKPPTALTAARSLLSAGRPVIALDSARVALAAIDADASVDSLTRASAATVFAEASLLAGNGGDPEAERRARQALAICDALHRPPVLVHVHACAAWANIAMATGNLREAARLRERNLTLWRADSSAEAWRIANDLDALAQIAGRRGEYAEAATLYDEALRVFDTSPQADPIDRFETLSNAVGPLLNLGRLDDARRTAARALDLLARLPAGAQRTYLCVLNAAEVESASGNDSTALTMCDDVRRRLANEPGVEPRARAGTASSCASFALALGDTATARIRMQEALAVWRSLPGRTRLPYALDMATYAQVLAAERDFASAAAADRTALSALDDLGMSLTRYAVQCARHLATVERAAGATDRALASALDAERRTREQLRLVTRGLSEREALRYATRRTPALDEALALAIDSRATGDSVRTVLFDALVRSRGIVLEELAVRRHLAGSADSTLREAWTRVCAARERLAYLQVSPPRAIGKSQLATQLARATADVETAESALAHRSKTAASLSMHGDVDAALVQRALPANAALVSFRAMDTTPARYVAFVTMPERRAPVLVDLGDRARIDSMVKRWRAAMAPETPLRSYRSAGSAVRAALWDPLASFLRTRSLVFLVPDGAIHLVSFDALPERSDSYVAESAPLLHYLGAERDLLVEPAAGTADGMFACGDPAFDAFGALTPAGDAHRGATPCADFASLRFGSLPQSGAEIDEVAAVWRAAVGRGPCRTITRAAATEALFRTEARGHAVIHLATHGFFIDPACAESATDPSVAGRGADVLPWSPGASPLLLSGFALAGANARARAASSRNDGVLLADEIATLDLAGTECAVLSACDTGVGVTVAGEGILGVRRAFAVAGVRTVLMSLWSTPDATLRRWSRVFYAERFAHARDVPHAARAANLAVLAARRAAHQSTHPSGWAGLIAAGAWR